LKQFNQIIQKNKIMPTTTPVTVSQTSPKGTINLKDLLNSALAAIAAPVIPIVTESLQAGSLTFNWKSIGIAAALGFVTWITKNLLQPSQTVITGTTPGGTVTVTPPASGTTTAATQIKQ
jgi:hypothetical protein